MLCPKANVTTNREGQIGIRTTQESRARNIKARRIEQGNRIVRRKKAWVSVGSQEKSPTHVEYDFLYQHHHLNHLGE